jgi:hypothetical protein
VSSCAGEFPRTVAVGSVLFRIPEPVGRDSSSCGRPALGAFVLDIAKCDR